MLSNISFLSRHLIRLTIYEVSKLNSEEIKLNSNEIKLKRSLGIFDEELEELLSVRTTTKSFSLIFIKMDVKD
jgi:hypothetical protein